MRASAPVVFALGSTNKRGIMSDKTPHCHYDFPFDALRRWAFFLNTVSQQGFEGYVAIDNMMYVSLATIETSAVTFTIP